MALKPFDHMTQALSAQTLIGADATVYNVIATPQKIGDARKTVKVNNVSEDLTIIVGPSNVDEVGGAFVRPQEVKVFREDFDLYAVTDEWPRVLNVDDEHMVQIMDVGAGQFLLATQSRREGNIEDGTANIHNRGSVYKTLDFGRTWAPVLGPVNAAVRLIRMEGQVILAGLQTRDTSTPIYHVEIYRSTDNGDTWTLVHEPGAPWDANPADLHSQIRFGVGPMKRGVDEAWGALFATFGEADLIRTKDNGVIWDTVVEATWRAGDVSDQYWNPHFIKRIGEDNFYFIVGVRIAGDYGLSVYESDDSADSFSVLGRLEEADNVGIAAGTFGTVRTVGTLKTEAGNFYCVMGGANPRILYTTDDFATATVIWAEDMLPHPTRKHVGPKAVHETPDHILVPADYWISGGETRAVLPPHLDYYWKHDFGGNGGTIRVEKDPASGVHTNERLSFVDQVIGVIGNDVFGMKDQSTLSKASNYGQALTIVSEVF